MKKYLILFSLALIGLSSCQKVDFAPQQAQIDDAKIQAYMKANNITAIKDPSGIYYQVLTPGTGAYPIATSTVQISYTNTYLNGVVFDKVSVVNYKLTNTIRGLQIGLLHINKGGRILLLIPSALGNGADEVNNIPANSVLAYTVDMIGFF